MNKHNIYLVANVREIFCFKVLGSHLPLDPSKFLEQTKQTSLKF